MIQCKKVNSIPSTQPTIKMKSCRAIRQVIPMQVGPMQDTIQEDKMQVLTTGDVILIAMVVVMVAVTEAID